MRYRVLLVALALSSALLPCRVYAEDVFFTSNGVKLSAAFFNASAGPSQTTIVMLPGAGNDSFRAPGHRKMMIERFRSAGLNVFIYDKPGVGQSGGRYDDSAPVSSMVADARSSIAYLKATMPGRAKTIGVFGVSRSAWTALEIAGAGLVDFDINVSPAVMQTMEQEIWARGNFDREQYALSGQDVDELDRMRSVVWQYYATGVGIDGARAAWTAAAVRPWFAKMQLARTMPDRASLDTNFLNYLKDNEYDVTPAAQRVTVKTLSVFGLNDGFVPAAKSAGNLIAALGKAKNTHSTIVVLPQTGHVMEIVESPIECTQCVLKGAALRPNPLYWSAVADWIKNEL